MFHVRRRPADHGPRKRKKKPLKGSNGIANDTAGQQADPQHQALPVLVELGPGEKGGGCGQLRIKVKCASLLVGALWWSQFPSPRVFIGKINFSTHLIDV